MYGERDTITFSKSLEAAFLVLPWHRSESGGWRERVRFSPGRWFPTASQLCPKAQSYLGLTALLPRSLLRWMSYFGEIYVLSIQKYEEAIYWGHANQLEIAVINRSRQLNLQLKALQWKVPASVADDDDLSFIITVARMQIKVCIISSACNRQDSCKYLSRTLFYCQQSQVLLHKDTKVSFRLRTLLVIA